MSDQKKITEEKMKRSSAKEKEVLKPKVAVKEVEKTIKRPKLEEKNTGNNKQTVQKKEDKIREEFYY